MTGATLAVNLLAYSVQIAVIVAACAALPRLLRFDAPGPQYFFWRLLLAACLALPFVEPWQRVDIGAVVTSVQQATFVSGSGGGAGRLSTLGGRTGWWLPWLGAAIAAGTLGRLVWLALGLVRLRSLRASARDTSGAFADLQATVGTNAAIGWCPGIGHPVTFGLRHPMVLLPASVETLEPAAARALVAHELFHVKRRDWGWLLVEEVLRAVFWFHPAMWWLVSRVQLARETVVDELSILATNARRTYMDALLAFADDSPLAPATAFSRRRHLFHRIMLLSREGSMSTVRLAVASLVLGAALLTSGAAAARAFPLQQPPRDPVPGQMTDAQRELYDKMVQQTRDALAREPNAPDLHNKLATIIFERVRKDSQLSDVERQSLLKEGIAEEDQALAVRPDYIDALAYKNILLRLLANQTADVTERGKLIAEADRLRDRGMQLRAKQAPAGGVAGGVSGGVTGGVAGGVPTMPPPPPPPPPPPGDLSAAPSEFAAAVEQMKPIRIGGQVGPPTKIKDVRPVYPPEAMASRVQGVVIIEALIDAQGNVAEARILRSIPLFDQAALDAVKQWKYVTPLLNGVPTPVLMTVTVNFTLQ